MEQAIQDLTGLQLSPNSDYDAGKSNAKTLFDLSKHNQWNRPNQAIDPSSIHTGLRNTLPPHTSIKWKMAANYPFVQNQDSYRSYTKQIENMDEVHLFWYELTSSGTVSPITTLKNENTDVLRLARQHKVRIIPTINNGDSANQLHSVLSTPANRTRAIKNITQFVVSNDYHGVNLQFEPINPIDRENLSLFAEELSRQLRQKNKILSISVFPKTISQQGNGSVQAQDWKRLGQASDEFKILAYNYSYQSPGPSAPLQWIDQVILYAKNYVPPEKIYINLPSYGYYWILNDKPVPLSYQQTQKLIESSSTVITRDRNGEPYFSLGLVNSLITVYFQDSESIEKKVSYLKNRHPDIGGIFNGFSGTEDPKSWEAIQKILHPSK